MSRSVFNRRGHVLRHATVHIQAESAVAEAQIRPAFMATLALAAPDSGSGGHQVTNRKSRPRIGLHHFADELMAGNQRTHVAAVGMHAFNGKHFRARGPFRGVGSADS